MSPRRQHRTEWTPSRLVCLDRYSYSLTFQVYFVIKKRRRGKGDTVLRIPFTLV